MPRMLLITNAAPLPTNSGGAQRSFLLHRALSELGHVDLFLVVPPASIEPAIRSRLEDEFGLVGCVPSVTPGRLLPWRIVRSLRPVLVEQVAYLLSSRKADYRPDEAVAAPVRGLVQQHAYDLIVGRYLQPTARAGAFAFGPLVLDIDDVDAEVFRSRLGQPGVPCWRRMLYRRFARQVERVSTRLLARCARVWVTKEEDRRRPGLEDGVVLPNIPFGRCMDADAGVPPDRADCRAILFVGMLAWRRNVEALDFCLQHVWPAVRRDCPDAVFRIVGSRLSARCRRRWEAIPGVDVVGLVDEIADAYRDAAFSIVPVFAGGGTNIKLLETLVHGRTCVVTPHGLRGYDHLLKDGEAVRVGVDADGLARACVDLLTHPDRRVELAAHGRRIVLEHYAFPRFSRVVRDTLAGLLADGTAPRRRG